MSHNNTVWQTAELTQTFLEGVRGAIPLAQEQLVVLKFLSRMNGRSVKNFLDLGCGDGILGQTILDSFPEAIGVMADFSKPMLNAAKSRLANYDQTIFVETDYGTPAWLNDVRAFQPFDLIISGFSIHHQPDSRKKVLYEELYSMLSPGGLFLNLEHVASHTPWGTMAFDQFFIESLVQFHNKNGRSKTAEDVANTYYNRPDKAANILTLVETQCEWLREIGFSDVDCFFKIFELAIFGGIK